MAGPEFPRKLSARDAAYRSPALQLTPLSFARRLRIAHAMHLLETTRDSVDEVAARVGYADAAAFRRLLPPRDRASAA